MRPHCGVGGEVGDEESAVEREAWEGGREWGGKGVTGWGEERGMGCGEVRQGK